MRHEQYLVRVLSFKISDKNTPVATATTAAQKLSSAMTILYKAARIFIAVDKAGAAVQSILRVDCQVELTGTSTGRHKQNRQPKVCMRRLLRPFDIFWESHVGN